MLSTLLNHFEQIYNEFIFNGFSSSIKARYENHWLNKNAIVWLESEQKRVQIVEIGMNGYLLAKTLEDPIQTFELHQDGNRFDMMKGLIRKKEANL